MYDPVLGRFLQRDPIGIWGDAINHGNGHAYVKDDPLDRTDPFGQATCCCLKISLNTRGEAVRTLFGGL
jgi:hypothetical protein